MSTCWSKPKNRAAPSTIFSQRQLSPRQIANKVLTLGCKKLDRDSRRSKQRYDTRIRVLINNQIQKAEEALNKRTRRTNRRVMAAEDDDIDLSLTSSSSSSSSSSSTSSLSSSQEKRRRQNIKERSPLCAVGMGNDDDDDDDDDMGAQEQDTPSLLPQNVGDQEKNHALPTLSRDPRFFPPTTSPTLKHSGPAPVVLARDCRPVELRPQLQRNNSTRIESIM